MPALVKASGIVLFPLVPFRLGNGGNAVTTGGDTLLGEGAGKLPSGMAQASSAPGRMRTTSRKTNRESLAGGRPLVALAGPAVRSRQANPASAEGMAPMGAAAGS